MLSEEILPFTIAAALGFSIGLERERRNVHMRSMGLRSFVLLALLGALTATLGNIFFQAMIGLFVFGSIIAGYLRTSQINQNGYAELGLTTELAAGATYLLGYLAHEKPWLSGILGVAIFALLWNRKTLHEFSRDKIKPAEIQATLILAALVIGIRPLLPEEPIDPWGIVHVKTLVTMITLILSIQFASYILIQAFGNRVGVPLWGFIAGLVSSTAVIFVIPTLLKQGRLKTESALAAALLATTSSLGLLVVLLSLISEMLVLRILIYTLPAIAIALLAAWYWGKRGPEQNADYLNDKNPIALWPAIKLAVALASIILLISGIQHFFGAQGTQIASFVGGLGELHAVGISIATLYKSQTLTTGEAEINVLIAIIASIISKIGLSIALNRNKYALCFTVTAVLMIGATALGWLV